MEIKERLFHARNIEIWVSPHATKHDLHIAHSSACGLQQLGKRVRIISQAPFPSQNICTVTLRGLAPRIARVAYEKDQTDLKLHFTLQQGNISAENVSLEVGPQADLTIIVGDNKTQYNHEAVYHYILELLLNSEDPALRLLGVALFKLEENAANDVCSATFTKEDLRAALTEPKHVGKVVEFLRPHFGNQPSFLFWFEKSPAVLQALCWTTRPGFQEQAVKLPGSVQKGNWCLWETSRNKKDSICQQLFTP